MLSILFFSNVNLQSTFSLNKFNNIKWKLKLLSKQTYTTCMAKKTTTNKQINPRASSFPQIRIVIVEDLVIPSSVDNINCQQILLHIIKCVSNTIQCLVFGDYLALGGQSEKPQEQCKPISETSLCTKCKELQKKLLVIY